MYYFSTTSSHWLNHVAMQSPTSSYNFDRTGPWASFRLRPVGGVKDTFCLQGCTDDWVVSCSYASAPPVLQQDELPLFLEQVYGGSANRS